MKIILSLHLKGYIKNICECIKKLTVIKKTWQNIARLFFVRLCYSFTTFTACGPLAPCSVSNFTFCPSFNDLKPSP